MNSVIDAKLDTQGKRVAYRRQALGFEPEQLALMVGMSRVGLSKIEKDEVKSARALTIFELAKALKCSAEWIVFGTGPIEYDDTQRLQHAEKAEFFVPILTNSEALAWQDAMTQADQFEKAVCPVPSSPCTFATEVNDNAMTTWMRPGDLAFVDPKNKTAEHDLIVLVKLMPSGAACFRKIENIGGIKHLVALNESYPAHMRYIPLTESPEIIGAVVCILRSGRCSAVSY